MRQIGKAIKNAIFRPCDIAARYGGDEFVMLLPDTDEAGPALIGERVRQAVSLSGIQHEGGRYGVVSVSVGIASFSTVVRTGANPKGCSNMPTEHFMREERWPEPCRPRIGSVHVAYQGAFYRGMTDRCPGP